jgi:hypothetical protein
MALTLSTQSIVSGQFVSPFTEMMAFNGSAYGPAVTLLAASGLIFDPSTLVPSTSCPMVTPAITAGAYTAGQEVGGLMTFPVGGASGILESIRVTCASVQTTTLKLYIFDANPTNSTWTDHSTPAINAADIPFLRGVFTLASPDSGLGTHTIWNMEGIAASFVAATLYGVMIVVGTPTFASTSGITVKLGIIDD